MSPDQVVELIRTGNLNYASFIQDCRVAGGAQRESISCIPVRSDHRFFLNEDESGIGGVVAQEPYAAVLSCIDARVPVELITGQAANDTFVIRTAGNTLTGDGEGSGSLRYILSNYGAGSGGEHPTVSAIFVFGHTKCGAVKAAYEAFKPNGTGISGMHKSLATILLEIKHAVDFVLGDAGEHLKDDEEIKNAISHVNAVFTSIRARQMAVELGVDKTIDVHYASYHVTDFYLRNTSFPNQSGQNLAAIIAKKGLAESLEWNSVEGLRDREARVALLDDAVAFAKKL
jgi:carbonic anhydrase